MKTTSEYTAFKTGALASEPLMRKISLADVAIVNDDTLMVSGARIKATQNAMNSLARIIGVPPALSNSFSTAYGKDSKQRLLELQRAAKLVSKAKKVSLTLIANPKSLQIEGILSDASILPFETYFDVFEKMVDSHNLEIENFGVSSTGSLYISTVNKANEFQVGNLKDEHFHPGFTLSNDIRVGTTLDSYLYRLVCSNGMVGKGFGNQLAYNPESMNDFFDKLNELKNNGYIPVGFQDKVKSATTTKASYAEVKWGADLIAKSSEDMKRIYVDKYIPHDEIRNKFAAKGVDVGKFNSQQQKNAITNVSVWDVVNGVTDFASHDYGFNLTADKKKQLQTEAGMMLAKGSYDTQNLVHVSLG